MLLTSLLLPVAAVLVQRTVAQSSSRTNATSTYYAPGIPTDVPVEGDYTDYLRPRVHFSPPRYFMNGRCLVIKMRNTR
jgi:beta-fructofuranosidase